jgi:hypothetical protein
MSTAVWTNQLEPNSVADKALKAAAGLWFLVAVIGQWAFLYYIVAFYGPSTFTGNFQVWNRNTFLNMTIVPGDTAGNLAFAAHTLLAAVIAFGGAMQLIPQIRARAISVHRWIGRGFRNGVGAQRLRPSYGMGAWRPLQHGRRGGDAHVAVLSEALDDAANCTSDAALQDQDCRKANF